MSLPDRIAELVTPLLGPLDLQLYDVELNGGNLRVTVDHAEGVSLDTLADATRTISRMLDEEDPMPGAFTLEVSSPGVERKLRTPAHFADAIGETVNLKLAPHVDGDRRRTGTLVSADDTSIELQVDDSDVVDLAIADITKATTVYQWDTRAEARLG